MTALLVIVLYLGLLLGLGALSSRLFRGTSDDFFVASRSIGPFLLLMSVFGTTMTAFALVGSTGESYRNGIGTFGKLASWSALVHSAVFFLIGLPLWDAGRRMGFLTQVQYFRARYQSRLLGTLLFPILVALVVPYLLIGIMGAGGVVRSITVDPESAWLTNGVPTWLTGLVVCAVVMGYIFGGGLRAAAWANTFQTLVFMAAGVTAVGLIASRLGGPTAATQAVVDNPMFRSRLTRADVAPMEFMTYGLVPLSVGMFPHIFQHWLTARSARAFRLSIVGHPLCILIVWLPCVLVGVWATSAVFPNGHERAGELIVPLAHAPNSELATMVQGLTSPFLGGLLAAGILAAIMSSLDSQFLCLGSMFTNDIVLPILGRDRLNDRQTILLARGFVVAVVALTYLLSLLEPRQVFKMGVWCFTGFTSLFPLVFASIYWRRATRAGAIASVAVAAVSWGLLFMKSGFGQTYLLLGAWKVLPVTVTFTLSAVALVLVSVLTRPPESAVVDAFFPRSAARPGGS